MTSQTVVKAASRSFYWDNCKGFLIVLVVFSHFLYNLQLEHEWNTLLVNAVYTFHMPAFVFISGYFSKSGNSRSLRSILLLGVAYFLYTAGFIIFNLHQGIPEISLTFQYYSSWYIFALIIWRLLTPYLANIRGIVFILVSFSVLAGFWREFDLKYSAAKIIVFYPYFMAGYLLQTETVNRFQEYVSHKRFLTGFVLLCVTTVCGVFAYKHFNITMQDLMPDFYARPGFLPAFARIAVLITASLSIASMLSIFIDKQIPLLTKVGKNSLAVYLLHRPVTLWFTGIVYYNSEQEQILKACIGTLVVVCVFGSDFVSGCLKKFLDFCVDAILEKGSRGHIKYSACRILLLVCFFDILLVPFLGQLSQQKYSAPIYRVMDSQTEEAYQKAFHLLFCGDLILLEDQVKNAYNGKTYDFSSCFEYTAKYISAADFAIGVFEGPLGGTSKNYSQSNFGDGKELYLNFPDEFADAVKAAGFDLVTTASNHLLDMGNAGVDRTIQVLRQKGIDYTGSYLNQKEKETERIKIIEKDGIRMAFLAYTYGVNNFDTEKIIDSELSCKTSFLVGKGSPHYGAVKESVQRDFEKAKSCQPDLIIVLPHWGTQFADKADAFQKTWQQNFLDFGADIILGDHTHSVQPVVIKEINGKRTFTLFSPGNYVNIYREHNGDASTLVEVVIDRKTKKIIGGSLVPMWAHSSYRGNYRALPLWDILTDVKLGREISTSDIKRVDEVAKHVTKIAFGQALNLNMMQERLFFDEEGFLRKKNQSLLLSDEMKSGTAYSLLRDSKTVCFVGDSITEGTKNGGIPWYEPIEPYIAGKIVNVSLGGCTSKMLLEDVFLQKIISADADLVVVAIGTNDVRYRDTKICAMNSEEYINNIQILQNAILKKKPNTKFLFIAPWTSTDGDINSKLPYSEKIAMNQEYSNALQQWCKKRDKQNNSINKLYINPNKFIARMLDCYPHNRYLIDAIHPNGQAGVQLYSESVLLYNE